MPTLQAKVYEDVMFSNLPDKRKQEILAALVDATTRDKLGISQGVRASNNAIWTTNR